MTTTNAPHTPAAIPGADDRALARPFDAGRVAASVVSGSATLAFGIGTVGALLVAVTSVTPLAFFAVVLAAMCTSLTALCGYLTWRWARSLPPHDDAGALHQDEHRHSNAASFLGAHDA